MTLDLQKVELTPFDMLVGYIEQYVPDGFRDDDGVWHGGPHQRDAFAALNTIRTTCAELGEALAATQTHTHFSEMSDGEVRIRQVATALAKFDELGKL